MEKKSNKNNTQRKNGLNKEIKQSLNNVDVIKKTKTNNSKLEIKKFNNNEDNSSDYSKGDKSSLSSNSLLLNTSSNRMNSEVDLDKIIAGRDESQNNIINLNNNFKIEEKEEEIENLNVNNILGNIYREVVKKIKIKKKCVFKNRFEKKHKRFCFNYDCQIK